MRSALCVALTLVLGGSAALHAQDRKFPYEALVETDGEYVRSGPGPGFYPTDKLQKGARVTVHRHDPGGWCMIAPPAGSFSWIRAEHVQKSGEDRGVLVANNVVVHVGSSLNPDAFTTIQGNLSKSDAVHILGEKTFPFKDGPKVMLKISPVRREWRWIQRKAIVAADAIQSEPFPQDQAPRRKPSGRVADQINSGSDPFAQPISTGDSVVGPARESAPDQQPRGGAGQPNGSSQPDAFKERLDQIDTQFRAMIRQEPSTWNLQDIRTQYEQLDNEATQPAQNSSIASRLEAVSRYEKTNREYLNFMKFTDGARQRDAQLASVQQEREAQLRALDGSTGTSAPGPLAPPASSIPQPQPAPGSPTASISPDDTPPADAAQPAKPPVFSGAGIVVPMARSFAGGPAFALVAPGGRLLAYLVPTTGVDLRRVINQPTGIIGDRAFRQDWGADTIVVRGTQPVQLRAGK
jgi:hypothetical protein